LKGSFVPPETIRRLRDLTRTRAKIGQNVATFANRIQKVLEDANVKLGSVATDVLGVSGREMLKALIKGQRDPKQLAQLARGRLRKKLSELQLALEGHFTEHHGFQIQALLELVESGEERLRQLEAEIQRLLLQEPEPCRPEGSAIAEVNTASTPPTSSLQRAVELLDTIPGVDKVTARTLVAEMGANMVSLAAPAGWRNGQGYVPAIMRARGNISPERRPKATFGCGERSVKRPGPRPAPRTRIWQPNTNTSSFARARRRRS
jgi:transposase